MRSKSFLSQILSHLFGKEDGASDATTTTDKPKTQVTNMDSNDETISTNATHQDEEQQIGEDATSQDINDVKDESAAHKQQESQETDFSPEKVMHALGVEIYEKREDDCYLVGFQGGDFLFCFEENRLNVMYEDLLECSYSDSIKASFVANNINTNYSVWNAYLRVGKHGNPEKPVKVCFSQLFLLIGNFDDTIHFIHLILTTAFSIGREFKEQFIQSLEQQSDLAQVMNHKDFIHKLELSKRLMEVGNWDNYTEEMPPSNFLKVRSLSTLFDDSEFGNPLTMKVYALDESITIDKVEEIEGFDIRDFIRNHSRRDELENLSMVVTFEKQDLVIHLKKMPGSSQNTFFFMLNVMRSGTDVDVYSRNQSTVSCRATVEIRLCSRNEDYWEVKYMLDEAREKQVKNDLSSLTAEQKMLLIQMQPNIQDDLYWGIKYFNQSCWFQALFYFKRIFYNLVIKNINYKIREELIADICFYLGVTFFQLKMYDRAYYYLDRARQSTTLAPSEWFAECLCRMKDPLASIYVKQMLEAFNKQFENSDIPDQYFAHQIFLKKKLIEAYINEERFRMAERYLLTMSNNEDDSGYVAMKMKEIKYLKKLVRKRNHKNSLDNENRGDDRDDNNLDKNKDDHDEGNNIA